MKHVNTTREKAAETVKKEVTRERHETARRLRRYYLKCLSKVLDGQGNR